jgi:glutaminyl-tRNA synthetase
VTKSDSWIDYSTLEAALRDDLDPKAARAMAVLDPVKLTITNWDAIHGEGFLDACSAPVHPHAPERGRREFRFGKELWIEKTDYEDVPPKGYNRLYPPRMNPDGSMTPGNRVRLKYGHVIECRAGVRDGDGNLVEVQAELVPDTKSGTPGSDAVKVKGVITWVGAADALKAEVRLYDRLFAVAQPDTSEKDFLEELNQESLKVVTAYVEPSLASAKGDDRFQFERHGYFVADRKEHEEELPVFNRVTGLRDSFTK